MALSLFSTSAVVGADFQTPVMGRTQGGTLALTTNPESRWRLESSLLFSPNVKNGDTVVISETVGGVTTAYPFTFFLRDGAQISVPLPAPVIGVPYDARPLTQGGSGNFRFFVASGQIPSGLALSIVSGRVFGIPQGSSVFALGLTDLAVPGGIVPSPPAPNPLSIVGVALTAATVNDTTPYVPVIAGGVPPYILSVSSGALPAGRSISGLTVAGTYTTAATYSYTLRVTDALGSIASLPVGPVIVSPVTVVLAAFAGTPAVLNVGTFSSATTQSFDTASATMYAEGYGQDPRLAVHYKDDNNTLRLQAVNGDGGFILIQRNASVETNLINYTGVSGGITAAMKRRIDVTSVSASQTTIQVTVGTTTNSVTINPTTFPVVSTKAAIIGGSNATSVVLGAPSTPLKIVDTGYDGTGKRVLFTITYISATSPTYEYQINGGAWADATVVSTTGPGNGVLASAALDSSLVGATLSIVVRQKGTSTTATTSFFVPPPLTMGLNDSLGWFADLILAQPQTYLPIVGGSVNYSAQLRQLGETAISPDIAASADGAGQTIKRDYSGGIYSPTGTTITGFLFRYQFTASADLAGDYTVQFPATMPISNFTNASQNLTNLAYNQATGKLTFTVPAAGDIIVGAQFNLVDIPSGQRVLPTMTKNGATVRGDGLLQIVVDQTKAMTSQMRFLDTANVNNANRNNRTTTAMAVRSPSNRSLTEYTVERQVAICAAIDGNLVYQIKHIDDDAMIKFAADYIAANMPVSKVPYYGFSNEDFNFIFTQTTDVIVMGARRGYAVAGATPGSSTPETIIDATFGGVLARCNSDGTLNGGGGYAKLLVAFASGDKVFLNAYGTKVYRAASAQTVGTVFNLNGDANFAVLYDSPACQTASHRFISARLAEAKVIFDTAFDALSRPRAKMWLDGFSAGGFVWSQDMLDWGNLYTKISVLAPGPYWGNGYAGAPLGAYSDATYSEWAPATGKGALYGTGTLASRIDAAKTAYFSAATKTVDATIAAHVGYAADLRTYLAGKGVATNSIMVGAYEYQDHTIFKGLGDDWPDTAALESQQLFASYKLDARQGALLTRYLTGMQKVGGPMNFYTRTQPITSNGSWAAVYSNSDTTANNFVYAALVNFKASLG